MVGDFVAGAMEGAPVVGNFEGKLVGKNVVGLSVGWVVG